MMNVSKLLIKIVLFIYLRSDVLDKKFFKVVFNVFEKRMVI